MAEIQRPRWRSAQRKWRSDPTNREKEAKRRNRDREKVATAARKATPEGWAKATIPRIRYRAKRAGLTFNLTWADIVPPEFCPVLGERLVLSGKHARMNWWSPSVDRIDNAKGYVKENVAVISNRANVLKKDATPDELRRLAEYVS